MIKNLERWRGFLIQGATRSMVEMMDIMEKRMDKEGLALVTSLRILLKT